MEKYNHQTIDSKWQQLWLEQELYKTADSQEQPKYYVLDMFPYPSGQGLHVGHPKGYIATDILARYKRLQGFNVLHPMGWDAFGLPAENYALKNKVHPQEAVTKNIATFKAQLNKLGLSYDWSREISTTDPEYYKWTQWTFIQMFKRGLVYQSDEPINWCPSCQTGLANEDLEDGKCERCGSAIIKKPLSQWVIRLTDYADRLLQDLEKLPDWEEPIKEMQRHWIGRSVGAEVIFKIKSEKLSANQAEIKVFTTRPDTLFGATYLVLCPEHHLIHDLRDSIGNLAEVEQYLNEVKHKSDLERTDLNKDKSGVKLANIIAINPVNNEPLPVFVADYVLGSYGTGGIMAVPAHDERDWAFARKYQLMIKPVVKPLTGEVVEDCFVDYGVAVNSSWLNGLPTMEAKEKMIDWLVDNSVGQATINYRLQDWVFSRQRYWGEPIPLIHCPFCGVVSVLEKDLPVRLPEVTSYEPSGTGESPLAKIEEWVKTTCPECGGLAKRETNTMPQWAGSCWYYLRYMDPHNETALVDKAKEKYWSPVDFYVGGAEHATRHLIYARFWHKFLFDIGVVNYDEPFMKLRHVGLILAEDGRKMSKRWNNVINPDEIVAEYGADALRVYEMFMGPFDQPTAWNTDGVKGARKFLDKVHALVDRVSPDSNDTPEVLNLLHKTIKKIGDDIEDFKFNTAISALMILVNLLQEQNTISTKTYAVLLQLLCPFAPHLCEELWQKLASDNNQSIFKQTWPAYDSDLAKDSQIDLVVQINGKVRATLRVDTDSPQTAVETLAQQNDKIKPWLVDKEIIKIIFVPNKLINIVIK